MAGRPLRSATDRRFGGPLPRQLPNQTRAHPIPPEFFTLSHAAPCAYAVLAAVSSCYPPVWGRSPTRYSPVRRSVKPSSFRRNLMECFARLACVKHAASVHPEPGSNSLIKCAHRDFHALALMKIVRSLSRFLCEVCSSSRSTNWLIYPFYCFKGSFDRFELTFRTFEDVFHCSVIKVRSFFRSRSCLSSNSVSLS